VVLKLTLDNPHKLAKNTRLPELLVEKLNNKAFANDEKKALYQETLRKNNVVRRWMEEIRIDFETAMDALLEAARSTVGSVKRNVNGTWQEKSDPEIAWMEKMYKKTMKLAGSKRVALQRGKMSKKGQLLAKKLRNAGVIGPYPEGTNEEAVTEWWAELRREERKLAKNINDAKQNS
jgi:hypothetical protein